MGYDRKYGIVTTEFGEIPEDEPVIVFRGRDKHIPALLEYYLGLCIDGGSPQHHTDLVADSCRFFEQWQAENPDRVITPTSDAYVNRVSSST